MIGLCGGGVNVIKNHFLQTELLKLGMVHGAG